MRVLPGQANLLLQHARKPSDVEPAPKQPKSTCAPGPKPASKPARFFLGRSVLYTHDNRATVGAKVVKNYGNGKYDIQIPTGWQLLGPPFLCLGP